MRTLRPKVSSRYMRPAAREGTQPAQHPRRARPDMHFGSPLTQQAHAYQAEQSARVGQSGWRTKAVSTLKKPNTADAQHPLVMPSSDRPHRESNYPQIIVTGLNGQVDRGTIEAMFATHGELINVWCQTTMVATL